jgi:hypothetical protein
MKKKTWPTSKEHYMMKMKKCGRGKDEKEGMRRN